MSVTEAPGIQAALSPPAPLVVKYPDTNLVIAEPGQKIKKALAKSSPTFLLASSVADMTKAYFVLALDLDAPFPSMPILSPVCHGIWFGMKVGDGSADNGEYKILESKETQVIQWIGPGPPPPSGPHRYTFTVWEQPAKLTSKSLKEALGATQEQAVGRLARMRFDVPGFEKKLGLGTPIAGTSFVV